VSYSFSAWGSPTWPWLRGAAELEVAARAAVGPEVVVAARGAVGPEVVVAARGAAGPEVVVAARGVAELGVVLEVAARAAEGLEVVVAALGAAELEVVLEVAAQAAVGPEVALAARVERRLGVAELVGMPEFGMAVKQVIWAGDGASNKIAHITAIAPPIPTSVTLDSSAVTITTKVRFLKRKPSAMI
jgi:hypothetical protein